MSWRSAEPSARTVFAVLTGLIAYEVPAGGPHRRSAVRSADALRAPVAEHRR